MQFDVLETRIRFHLHGKSAPVPSRNYAEVGLPLMDEMWRIVKQTGTATTGTNHWVYLGGGRMFVGVELLPSASPPAGLEPLDFTLRRYLKHLHVGPYQALPAKWKSLMDELAARGEAMEGPGLEVYGHHCGDPAKLETTILIGLAPQHA